MLFLFCSQSCRAGGRAPPTLKSEHTCTYINYNIYVITPVQGVTARTRALYCVLDEIKYRRDEIKTINKPHFIVRVRNRCAVPVMVPVRSGLCALASGADPQ